MKIPARTARWFVSPARDGVTLTVDGLELRMSAEEADNLAGCLDDACQFVKVQGAAA